MHHHLTTAALLALPFAVIAVASPADAETVTVCLDGSCDFTTRQPRWTRPARATPSRSRPAPIC